MGSEQTGSFHSVLNEQVGPSHNDPFLQSQWDDSGPGLTFIGYQVTFIMLSGFDFSSRFSEKLLTFAVSF